MAIFPVGVAIFPVGVAIFPVGPPGGGFGHWRWLSDCQFMIQHVPKNFLSTACTLAIFNVLRHSTEHFVHCIHHHYWFFNGPTMVRLAVLLMTF